MTDYTDRIKQMAQEAHAAYLKAGRALPRDFSDDTHRAMWEAATATVAQLVAEDCGRIADESEPRRAVGDEIRYYYSPDLATPSQAG